MAKAGDQSTRIRHGAWSTAGAAALLCVGLLLWMACLGARIGNVIHLLLLLAVAAVALLPPGRRLLGRWLDRLRHPTSATAWTAAAAIAAASALYLYTTAILQASAFVPLVADESSYLIQMRMLASGRLWTDPHPPAVRPFFESFNILVEPVYGSMYFPGTALLYVPAIWLGLPYWLMPLLASAACVGLIYRLTTGLLDGVYGLASAVMLLGLTKFRALSVMLFSQTPMLLMGLLLLLVYLRWRRKHSIGLTLVIGGLAGWAGITRPADALCYSVPVGIAMLLDLRKGRPAAGPGVYLKHAIALVVAAMPFLALQAMQNAGMTGHWWEFPEARYAEETYPAPMLGFHDVDSRTAAQPRLQQKRDLNEQMVRHLYASHQPAKAPGGWWSVRLPMTLTFGLPHPLIAILLPLGLLGMTMRPRIVVGLILPLFVGFYAFYVFYIPHYIVVLAPALILITLMGAQALESILGHWSVRLGQSARVALPLSLVLLSVASLPELNPDVRDADLFGPGYFHGELPVIEATLDELDSQLAATGGRALVLFSYHPSVNAPDEEPVYNRSTVWPDDARVVRAHDLGPANQALFDYYAITAAQPDRQVYVYDRRTLTMAPLGPVDRLAGR